ncbi:hypothetical protein [Kineococcus sp. SYSU DK004]|uniref:hypothetical protein n=1 Tax=Kineococcus sp. SYSU DK004 TaxID=3383125 RepID=UPI003D7E00BE
MRLGSALVPPAARGATAVDRLVTVRPAQRITPDYVDEDPIDALTVSDRALLWHLYGGLDTSGPTGRDADRPEELRDDVVRDRLRSTPAAQLAAEIARERARGTVSGGRDLTAEDVRRAIGHLTLTSPDPVPVEVQLRLWAFFAGDERAGRLDVVL